MEALYEDEENDFQVVAYDDAHSPNDELVARKHSTDRPTALIKSKSNRIANELISSHINILLIFK